MGVKIFHEYRTAEGRCQYGGRLLLRPEHFSCIFDANDTQQFPTYCEIKKLRAHTTTIYSLWIVFDTRDEAEAFEKRIVPFIGIIFEDGGSE